MVLNIWFLLLRINRSYFFGTFINKVLIFSASSFLSFFKSIWISPFYFSLFKINIILIFRVISTSYRFKGFWVCPYYFNSKLINIGRKLKQKKENSIQLKTIGNLILRDLKKEKKKEKKSWKSWLRSIRKKINKFLKVEK